MAAVIKNNKIYPKPTKKGKSFFWAPDWLHVIHLWWRIWSSIYTQFKFYHARDLLLTETEFLFVETLTSRWSDKNKNKRNPSCLGERERVKTKVTTNPKKKKLHWDLDEVIVNRRTQFKLIAIKSGTDSNLLCVTSDAAGWLLKRIHVDEQLSHS